MITTTLIILFHLPMAVLGKEICYERLGCFSDSKPWSGTPRRMKIPLPWAPEKINTRFFLLTRKNPDQHQEIDAIDMQSLQGAPFDASHRTCFIVHGMGDRAENNWVPQLCQEILQVEDVNCIGVDWHHGSGNLLIYNQATSNVRVVGAEIASVLRTWQVTVSGLRWLQKWERDIQGSGESQINGSISLAGLDPARLHFEDTPREVSLDASDANFVDIIHTDTHPLLGLGLMKPAGHFDFYPNGGQHMPGCPDRLSFLNNMNALVETIACNHQQASRYYIESVRSPGGFLSYPCPDYESFKDGSCFPCPPAGCPPMGHYSEPEHSVTSGGQTYYLHTGPDPGHFSSYRYKVTLIILGAWKVSAQIFITLFGDERSSDEHQVMTGSFTPGDSYSGFIDSEIKVDEVNCVDFLWTPSPPQSNVLRHQMGAAKIDFQSGEDGRIFSFCTTGTVRDNTAQTLGLCRETPYWLQGHRTKTLRDFL
ncbi:hypothetical protein GDO81_023148 [Engystomops pustulosus]|uniref:Triacylglycerol lipase n=1 Tax=Engystomops pustulosus TaxID=76066 RepID=A0AAV6Z9P6_ENGPU|nr:hypothetical protein GDO81_023148 [Engystomops pustulosus]